MIQKIERKLSHCRRSKRSRSALILLTATTEYDAKGLIGTSGNGLGSTLNVDTSGRWKHATSQVMQYSKDCLSRLQDNLRACSRGAGSLESKPEI